MHVALVAPRGFYDETFSSEYDPVPYYFGLAKILLKNGIRVTVLCEASQHCSTQIY